MSKYTTTIKNLITYNFDFGLDKYPIFSEDYRETLNNNILNYYYENEIGFETAELFKKYLNNKMMLIMPYFNRLYEEQVKLGQKLSYNVELTEDLTRNTSNQNSSTSNSTSNSTNNSKNQEVFQDTPQGKIYNNEIENMTYATNVTTDKGNTTNNTTMNDTSSNKGTGEENYIKGIIGNNGNKYFYEILADVKDKLYNIDLLIIQELDDLFLQIY